MSASRSTDVPTRAVEAAAALLMDEPQDVAAPYQEAEAPQEQPERRPGRAPNGRFVPREPSAPTPTTPEQDPASPATPPPADTQAETDWRAIAQQREQDLNRLRGTYGNNVAQLRERTERAEREAAEVRRVAEEGRTAWLAELRAGVQAMPDDHPEKVAAERDLYRLELQEARRIADAEAARRTQLETETTQQREVSEDVAHRAALWTTVETFAERFGAQQGLSAAEINEVLTLAKTPELGAAFRRLDRNELTGLVKDEIGPRVQRFIAARVDAKLEQNRREAVASGAHQHDRPTQTQPAAPAYQKYTRGFARSRGGVDNAANAILAGILEEE